MFQQAIEQISSKVLIRDRYDNFIGGKWVAPVEGRYFDNPSPVTGQKLCQIARSSAADVELALDCRSLFDTESAIQVAKVIEPYRPMWLGEPTTSDNPEVIRHVREATRVSIACGENIYMGSNATVDALRGWFLSPGHHKNMLAKHARVGVGRHGVFFTEMFGD